MLMGFILKKDTISHTGYMIQFFFPSVSLSFLNLTSCQRWGMITMLPSVGHCCTLSSCLPRCVHSFCWKSVVWSFWGHGPFGKPDVCGLLCRQPHQSLYVWHRSTAWAVLQSLLHTLVVGLYWCDHWHWGSHCYYFFVLWFILFSILCMCFTEGRSKAFTTCSSHRIVRSLFFGSGAFMYLKPPSILPLGQGKVSSVFYAQSIDLCACETRMSKFPWGKPWAVKSFLESNWDKVSQVLVVCSAFVYYFH